MNNLQGATDDEFEFCCIWHHIIGFLDICCLIAPRDCSNNCELSHSFEGFGWPPNVIAFKCISAHWDAFKSLKLTGVLIWLAVRLTVFAGIVWVPPSSCAVSLYAAWWYARARPCYSTSSRSSFLSKTCSGLVQWYRNYIFQPSK